jgi:hypothetical protein
LKLLVGRKGQASDCIIQQDCVVRPGGREARCRRCEARCGSRNEAAVIAPVESNPWSLLPWLVLNVRCLVVALVVVNAENVKRGEERDSCNLGIEESRRNAGHDHQRRQPMIIRKARAKHPSGNLGIVPLNRKGDRRGADNAKVESVVGVFPDVFARNHQVFAEGLLETGMELIAESRSQRSQLQVTPGGDTMAAITGSPHPVLAIIRFSLNGVSIIRA